LRFSFCDPDAGGLYAEKKKDVEGLIAKNKKRARWLCQVWC